MTERLVEARARIEQFLAHIGQYQRHIGGLAVEDIRALLDTSRAVDEPTEAMVEAGARILHRHVVPEEPWEDCPGLHDEHRRAAADAYRAMRAAQGERL